MTATSHIRASGNAAMDALLDGARRRIEVTPEELAEARSRRTDIATVLRAEFTGGRVYVNGSVAHGDANTPLNDIDLGIVVPDPNHEYGPGKRGPGELQERAARAIRAGLGGEFDNLSVEHKDNKRSVLVRFREPVGRGKDFTADVIVAIDNMNAAGLYIPRFHMWDRSHPEKHTELIVEANRRTDSVFARTVRIVKHWNRSNGRPLCSWHIKTLALGSIDRPVPISDAVLDWFVYAEGELRNGPTPDPAHVSDKPVKSVADLSIAIDKVAHAAGQLSEAYELARQGERVLAQDKLSKWMKDDAVVPAPTPADVAEAAARRLQKTVGRSTNGPTTGVGAGSAAVRPRGSSWGLS